MHISRTASALTLPSDIYSDQPTMHVKLLPGPRESAPQAPVDMISQIKSFCETKRFGGFKNFILPCGSDVGCTT